jgi:hypothetical protein
MPSILGRKTSLTIAIRMASPVGTPRGLRLEGYAADRQTPFHDREEAAKLGRRSRGVPVTIP